MIRENVSVTVNSYTLDGEIIVPSVVMTSTPQEENGDLSYAPNFLLKLDDAENTLNVTDNVEAEFILGEYNYTTNMKVMNRAGNKVTLQYVDGMTKEEAEPPVTGPGFEYVGELINNIGNATWIKDAEGWTGSPYRVDSQHGDVDVAPILSDFMNVNTFNFLYDGDIFMSSIPNTGIIYVDIMTWYDGDSDEITFDPADAGFYFGAPESFSATSETGEAETRTADVYAVVKKTSGVINLDDIMLARNEETGKYEYNGREYDSIDDFINTIPAEFRQYFSNYTPISGDEEDTPSSYYIECHNYREQILNYWNNMRAKIGTATMNIAAYVPASSITCDPTSIDKTFTIESDGATDDKIVTGDGNFSFSVTDNLERDRSSEVTVEWEQISIGNIDLGEEHNFDREALINANFVDPTYNSITGKIEGYIEPTFFEAQWLDVQAGWQAVAVLSVRVENIYAEQRINFSGNALAHTIYDIRSFDDNTDFTFDGDVTVINKTSNNRELYIQDADGTSGMKLYQNNIASDFSTGDVINGGWSGNKYTYQGATNVRNITNLNISGYTAQLIAKEGDISWFNNNESGTYNYYIFRNVTINANAIEDGQGNTMPIYNNFNVTIPNDSQQYNVYGVVGWYSNAAQFYPMTFEVAGGNEPAQPYFSSPADGDTITGTIDSELGEFRCPIEVVGSDGNIVSNDNTSMCVTIDGNDWSVGYAEDYDEATGSTIITEVYIACSQAATGTATLTYDDSDTGETCTTTFTYNITAQTPA